MIKIFISLLFILSLSSCQERDTGLKQVFIDPPLSYRMNQNLHSCPLYPEGQDSLINIYLELGYGGFAMNAPFNHYLTDEGMKATLEFSEKAKSKGMELWLYDEKGYPSGNAGDLVKKANPDWECMGLYFKDTVVAGGMVEFRLPPGKPEIVSVFPVKDQNPDLSNEKDLMGFVNDEFLNWSAPDGNWMIIAVSKYRLYESFQASHKGGSKVGANYPSLMISQLRKIS